MFVQIIEINIKNYLTIITWILVIVNIRLCKFDTDKIQLTFEE